MEKKAVMLIFMVLFHPTISSAAPDPNNPNTDELSLLSIKARLQHSDILANNWTQETPVCSWAGVRCGRRHPRVTGLYLSDMGLQGTIAREIGNLSFLTFLNMSNNSINGPIPAEIGNLRRLRVLDMALNYLSGYIPASLSACVQLNTVYLYNNSLTGNIPTGFGNLSQLHILSLRDNQLTGDLHGSPIFNISSLLYIQMAFNKLSGSIPNDICSNPAAKLEQLWLGSNQFKGEIPSTLSRCRSLKQLSLWSNNLTGNVPSELWNLSNIEGVYLGRNGLTGTIPTSIGNLSNLALFDISENRFSGIIPPEMGQLSSLTWLNLEVNMFYGEVPQSIFNLSRLTALSLSINNLSGSLPVSIDKGLPNIEQLFLRDNRFHGEIPRSISNLSKLSMLELSRNLFAGYIPIELGNLRQLRRLFLSENQLTNNLSKPEQDFLSPLTSCEYLNVLVIAFNPITGSLPKSFGASNLSTSLQMFDARSCKIGGQIPDEIGKLSNMVLLSLGSNELSGNIPTTLGELSMLQGLGLNDNKLHGSISGFLCNLSNLYAIDLSRNYFSGQLPWCVGSLSQLEAIDFSGNAFNSSIPSALWSNEKVEKIYLSNNFLDGPLSREIGNMKSLIELNLSGNQFTGEIPETISQLQMLTNLSLSDNKLDGSITESFADMKGLLYLDLSRNNLSGQIPTSLVKMSSLSYFNVSFNQLSGEIPDTGPFVNFTEESFSGNEGLCGAARFKVDACKITTPTSSRKNKVLIYTLPIAASVVVIVIILVLVLIRYRGRKLPVSSPPDLPIGFLHERISYYDILRSTNNLDEAHLIGRGSFGAVYKGDFADATVAAVKVFDLDVQDALKSFDIECQVMRNIRHRNLVKVITSCSNLDFKAIVMAYMPNGNLEKWLYSANSSSLNVLKRLGIVIDVASALEYLHEGYTTTIVHCDLKPTNILLDEDMVAHVADFGIAKLLTAEQRMQQTRTLGTIGYMAPEYGSEGLISTMVDVYSYGILLMEVFSRRKPTDEMFTGELTMKGWVSQSFPNSVTQIVDQELLNMADKSTRAKHESCFTSIIELALECTADLPEKRPNMKDVVARINKIKLNLSNGN